MKKLKDKKDVHINLLLSLEEHKALDKLCGGVYGAKTTLIRKLIREFLLKQGLLGNT